ncbi:hypothetical protein [Roseiarcus sp.]|uniref:hypothetical protein n=1 Tax=Roseiarcus sp. TaxID=1969460 RepID=UPI003F9443D3
MAGLDGYAGAFTIDPGVARPFTLNFSDNLAPYDAVASVISTSVSVAPSSKVQDTNAVAIGSLPAAVIGNSVCQKLGNAAPAGFQPGVIYLWAVTVATVMGARLVGYARIRVRTP